MASGAEATQAAVGRVDLDNAVHGIRNDNGFAALAKHLEVR
jgi:hypothetical protein